MVLGVDIGGTKIATGLVNERAEVSRVRSVPTLANEGYDVSIRQVWGAIEESLTGDVKAIGICAPGPLNPKTGVVLNPPNLFGWRNVELVKMLEKEFGVPAKLENDANAAGLAESLFGAAMGYCDIFYVTVSTGIGTGLIINGKIYHGKNGVA